MDVVSLFRSRNGCSLVILLKLMKFGQDFQHFV